MIRILCRCEGASQTETVQSDDVAQLLKNPKNVIWLDLCLSPEGTAKAHDFLAKVFQFHPLALEDALFESHLARVDDWQKYLYLAFHAMELQKNHHLKLWELDIFLGANYLVTIHFDPVGPLQRLWEQVEKGTNPLLMPSADRLLYSLFDKIVSESMEVVEKLDDAMDDIEQQVYIQPRREHLTELFRLRRTVLQLRRIFGSQRETMNRMARDSFSVIPPEGRVYFRDIYDHLVRMHELTDGLRDMASGALESHLSVVSYRMNEVMRTLTVVTVLFMPLTFITGFFGMNFFAEAYNVPNPISPRVLFWLCMISLVVTPAVMLWWMARRGWLKSQLSFRSPGRRGILDGFRASSADKPEI